MPVNKVVVTLSTVPGKLIDIHGKNGIPSCIKSLCEQTYQDYEVHFNIPYIYKLHNTEYIIPEWLIEFETKYPHLKTYRTEDVGPPTKLLPTLERISDPETIIVVVDDDLVYHEEMVKEHVKNQLEKDYVFGYDGLGIKETEFRFGDVRDHYVVSVYRNVLVNMLQHYKTVSYKRKYFENDLWENFVGKTSSDDVLFSAYMNYKQIPKIVLTYEKEEKLMTIDDWRSKGGVTTFPVLRHTHHEGNLGCNDPAHGEKFFIPQEFIDKRYI